MVIEAESGFHFRRRDDCLRIAMADAEPRWGYAETVDETVFADRIERLADRYPPAAGTRVARAWAGLYDMTPDAHPIIGPVGDGLYAACGFSGHGFMQSPAVGRQSPRSCSKVRLRSTCRLTGSGASRTERRFGRSSFSEGGEPPPVHSNASPSRESCSLT